MLEHTVWPTLILSKIIHFPFWERFDYIYIFAWLMVILPPCCVYLWSGIRILRETLNIKPKILLWISTILVYIMTINITSIISLEKIGSFISIVGFVIIYCYIPVLFFWLNIMNFFKRRNKAENKLT